ncbi:hypothetical protein COY29_05735 [Candidatus Woesebacteria bacterium CG_4_10_14_0_2_um_filter_39_14]|uniref:AbiEi antitoxin N-terminal domain-containing protein n=2 Tax=Microgenomates group TaxID=1794810 RepID=A0A2M7XL96_9BACT|nr:MAG: hypothetical protein COY29_05735 [Candidatus Woesebacteria bacterium CG_4_10_14_0_2_um_filter_39_14]PJA49336.1 MAG: hypothetical protein CO169_02240 [Candidatus Shapirobacteria bacterium CG_4_9_14_3_um_filter_39_13]
MATRKLNTMDFIKTLQELDRGFFTVADFEKITGLSKNSLKVTLNRLVKQGILTRLKRGIYQLSLSAIDVKRIANQLYYPSYLSFESALSDYGLLSQIPFTQTFATTRKSKKMTIWKTEVEFTQIKKDLFFGYTLDKGIYIAEPEKALLDELYLISRGKRTLDIKELDLGKIDKKKFDQYAKRFPAYLLF